MTAVIIQMKGVYVAADDMSLPIEISIDDHKFEFKPEYLDKLRKCLYLLEQWRRIEARGM